MVDGDTCQDCRAYWDRGDRSGECRRKSPIAFGLDRHADFCLEFVGRDEEVPK